MAKQMMRACPKASRCEEKNWCRHSTEHIKTGNCNPPLDCTCPPCRPVEKKGAGK